MFNSNGNFLAQLGKPNGTALAINGLWTLTLGGGAKSSSDTLYFTAGPNGETNGLFGTIRDFAIINPPRRHDRASPRQGRAVAARVGAG